MQGMGAVTAFFPLLGEIDSSSAHYNGGGI